MKKYSCLTVAVLLVSLLSGCALQPFGRGGGAKPSTSSARDYVNYAALDFRDGEVLIKANAGSSLEELLARMGSTILYEWPQIGWAAAAVPAGETAMSFAAKLKDCREVLLVEPNLSWEIPDPIDDDIRLFSAPEAEEYDRQWGLRSINAPEAWAITTGSPDVIVAIIDTGVDAQHPEFAGKAFVEGFDATGEGTPTLDLHGHGTHVAGIAADDGRTGKIAGVAWDCPIMPVRVMDSGGRIWTSYLTEAMLFLGNYAAADPGKRIVANMSIGGRGYSFAFKDAIDYAAEQGVLLVTSAGNSYKRVISYPSAYNGVVSVAASTPWMDKADFSTTGWWNSVAAPGVNIYSTVTGGGYEAWQGTSMAAPFVTGAAALLLSRYPELTPLEMKNQLEQTAQGMEFTEELGFGVIDAAAMLGELVPMMYGSLKVKTNLTADDDEGSYGVIAVFSGDGVLVAYGTTGYDGSHTFHAMYPGNYTVTVAYFSETTGQWELASQAAPVLIGETSVLNFAFQK